MTTASTTPIDIEIRRHVRFDFLRSRAIHQRGNPYLSHFWNALSVLAPSTERSLIRVAKKMRPAITDERLRHDLDALVAQEGLHTREHRAWNARLEALGYDLEGVNAHADRILDEYVERVGPQGAVALMIAGEHLIYEISRAALADPHVTEGMDDEVRKLFLWHAAEEMEHQSVAHDLYVHLYGDGPSHRVRRARALVDAATLLGRLGGGFMKRLLVHERTTQSHRLEFARFMLVSPGFARKITPRLLRFVLPSFAPWSDTTDVTLIGEGIDAATQPAA